MDISVVSAPTLIAPIDTSATKSPDILGSSSASIAEPEHQPPPPPPLPPGQGTRIDQLV